MREYIDNTPMRGFKFAVLALVLVLLSAIAFAITQLINIQGKVTDSNGDLVDGGNLVVYVFNASTGGDPIYNSTSNFNSEINNGIFNVLVGSTTTLDLDYGQSYWLDFEVNNKDLDWDGSERTQFASAVGEITGSAISTANETANFHMLDNGGRAINITQADDEAAISVSYSGSGDGAINITSTNTGPALYIDQGSYPDYGAVHIDNTKSSGMGMYIYSNYGSGMHDALLKLYADNAAFDVPVLYIDNDGAEDALYIENEGSNFGLNVNNTFVVNNTAGKVGMGTLAPVGQLEIETSTGHTVLGLDGVVGSVPQIDFSHNDVVHGYVYYDGAQGSMVMRSASVNPQLWLANSTNGGGVGIGTSSPGAKLDVTSTGTGMGVQVSLDGVIAQDTAGVYIDATAANTNSGSNVFRVRESSTSSTDDTVRIDSYSSGHGLLLEKYDVLDASKYALYVYSNQIQTNDHLVKIWQDHSSSTKAALYVETDGAGPAVRIVANSSTNLQEALRLNGGAADSSSGPFLGFGGDHSDTTWRTGGIGTIQTGYGSDYKSDMVFYTNDGGGVETITEKMILTDDGRLGIGTSNPNGPFHVQTSQGGIYFATDSTDNWIESTDAAESAARDLTISGHSAGNIGTLTLQATNVAISGDLSKGSGSFRIDHPLDPYNKYLQHSFVESPEMRNLYLGQAQTSGGKVTIELPEWWTALNGEDKNEYTYHFTPIGSPEILYVSKEIENEQFEVRTASGRDVKFSWQVTAIRHDAYADARRIEVELEKDEKHKGKVKYPEAGERWEEQHPGAAQ